MPIIIRIVLYNRHMSLSQPRYRFSQPYRNPVTRHEPRKLQVAKQRLEILRHEVNRLKYMQYQLVNYIKLFIKKLPAEMEKQWESLTTSWHKDSRARPKQQVVRTPTKVKDERITTKQTNYLFESKLKQEDSAIKASILEELRAIKMLENKQNNLRMANQQHHSVRKSISKESIFQGSSCKRVPQKLQFASKVTAPEPIPTRQPIPIRVLNESSLFSLNQSTAFPSNQSSPRFVTKCDENTEVSFQSTFEEQPKKIEKLNKGTTYLRLHCENGHQYYKGDTKNGLPHGEGTLRNCCNRIPLKIEPKMQNYKGGFCKGIFEGKGTLQLLGGVRFEGQFHQGMRQGQGVIFLNGVGERGKWQKDRLITFL